MLPSSPGRCTGGPTRSLWSRCGIKLMDVNFLLNADWCNESAVPPRRLEQQVQHAAAEARLARGRRSEPALLTALRRCASRHAPGLQRPDGRSRSPGLAGQLRNYLRNRKSDAIFRSQAKTGGLAGVCTLRRRGLSQVRSLPQLLRSSPTGAC